MLVFALSWDCMHVTVHTAKNGESVHQPKIDSGTFALSLCIYSCWITLAFMQSSLWSPDIVEKVTLFVFYGNLSWGKKKQDCKAELQDDH